MAHVDLEAVRLAFRARLIAESARFASVVAAGRVESENVVIDKPGGATWARETVILALEQKSASGQIETTGRVQFDTVVPIGQGTAESSAFAREVAEAFTPGVWLTLGDGTRVYVDRAERLTGVKWDGTWYASPVSVLWRVYTLAGD